MKKNQLLILSQIIAKCYFLSLLFLCFPLFSQKYTFITNKERIDAYPNVKINQIEHDSNFFLWFATEKGLMFFDGLTYEYINDPKLGFTLSEIKELEIIGNNIFFRTGNKMGKYHIFKKEFMRIQTRLSEVKFVKKSMHNTLWGISKDLEVFNVNEEGILSNNQFPDLKRKLNLKFEEIESLYKLNKNEILLNSKNGIFIIDIKSQNTKKIFAGKVEFLTYLKDNKIVYGNGSQIFRANISSGTVKIEKTQNLKIDGKLESKIHSRYNMLVLLANNKIYATLSPYDDFKLIEMSKLKPKTKYLGVWFNSRTIILSNENGIDILERNFIVDEQLNLLPEGVKNSNKKVGFIFNDKQGNILYNVAHVGNFKMRISDNKIRKVNLPINTKGIIKTTNSDYLIFDDNCLYKSVKIGEDFLKLKLYEKKISKVLEIENGVFLIGFESGGVQVFSNNKDIEKYKIMFENINLQSTPVSSLVLDDNNNVWIGSKVDGLIKVNLETSQYYNYRSELNLSNKISCLLFDSWKRFWVGTYDSGLFLYQPEVDTFLKYDKSDGLPNLEIKSVIDEASGVIFVSTVSGIAKYIPNQPYPFVSYGSKYFNNSMEFSEGGVLEKENIFYPNVDGILKITNYTPSIDDKMSRKIAFRVLYEGSKTWSMLNGNIINLEPKNKQISIKPFNGELGFPEKIKFTYRLNSEDDKDWKIILGDNPTFTLSNLENKSNILEIKSTDSFGFFDYNTTILKIVKPTSFFKSYFIFIVLIFCIGFVFFYLYRKRLKLINAKQSKSNLKKKTVVYGNTLPWLEIIESYKLKQSEVGSITQSIKSREYTYNQLINSEEGSELRKIKEVDLAIEFNSLANSFSSIIKLKNCKLIIEKLSFTKNIKIFRDFSFGINSIILDLILKNIKDNDTIYFVYSILNGSSGANLLVSKYRFSNYGINSATFNKVFNSNSNFGILGNNWEGNLLKELLNIINGSIEFKELEEGLVELIFKQPFEETGFNMEEEISNLEPAKMVMAEDFLEGNTLNEQKSTILLVDDMPEIRKFIKINIGDIFNIVDCSSYFEAIELLKTNKIDLILSDLYMPEKSGIDLLLKVKKDDNYKNIPFIILTGNNHDKQQVLALKYGVDDFLEKPILMEILTWKIKNIINNKINIAAKLNSPSQLPSYVETSEDEKFLNEIVEIIENNISNKNMNMDLIADEIGMSRATFYRKSEGILKTSPSAFVRSYILKRGAIMLKNSGKNISQIAYAIGYSNPKYFSRAFSKEFGMSPKEYMNSGEEDIA